MKALPYSAHFTLFVCHFTPGLSHAIHSEQDILQVLCLYTMTTERQRLPGDNDARYSRIPEADQLFKIEEFDISPRPPAA